MAGSELIPESDKAVDTYGYSALSKPGNIRLIRLMRHKDKGAPIHCQLFEYPLQEPGQGSYLYEALSYVWGSEEGKQPIYIQELDDHGDNSPAGTPRCLRLTSNLYAALSHLRDRLSDRVLWIDAICINQKDNKEKGQQVQAMAKIYASATRVIVWLGEAASDSSEALEALCRAAARKHVDQSAHRTILALLERPWFQRIWVICEKRRMIGHARR